MSEDTKLYVKVCSKCRRQVNPPVDHNLGPSRIVYCAHGKLGPGTMESVTWERIEVVPVEVREERDKLREEQREAVALDIEAGRVW